MDKFNLRTAKFLGIIIVICLTFVLIIAHAYTYIPQDDTTKKLHNNEYINNTDINAEDDGIVKDNEESSDNNNQDEQINPEIDVNSNIEKIRSPRQEEIKHSNEELEPLTPIEEKDEANENEIGNKENETNPIETIFNHAKDLLKKDDFATAISEYEKAMTLTTNPSVKAQCYENIARIHAYNRRYGSAIAAAQRAYNLQANISREVLLARLYYKTGNTEKANYIMNSVLRKEFSQND